VGQSHRIDVGSQSAEELSEESLSKWSNLSNLGSSPPEMTSEMSSIEAGSDLLSRLRHLTVKQGSLLGYKERGSGFRSIS